MSHLKYFNVMTNVSTKHRLFIISPFLPSWQHGNLLSCLQLFYSFCKLLLHSFFISVFVDLKYNSALKSSVGSVILFSSQSLVPRVHKKDSKTKAGAIKCCKENKITDLPNAWHNIPFI